MSSAASIVHSSLCVINSTGHPDRCTCGADPDMSPFESPSFETVEKGIPGPWEPKDDS